MGSQVDTSGMSLAETVGALVARRGRRHVGLVAAVDARETSTVVGHGTAGIEGAAGPPDDRTLFQIGSITKVFTATLLSLMAGAGEVGLDEPVADLVPDAVRLPVRGRPITLLDLATHRSGLPRLPGRWLLRAARAGANPYAIFTVDDVWDAAATTRRRSPGGRPRYSNLGVGLLGHALAHRAGRDWADLVSERLCEPLGLVDTGVTVTSGAARTGGHDRRGRPVPAWEFPVLTGAGALWSTAGDVIGFLRAQDVARAAADEPERDTPLNRAIRATHVEHARRGPLGQCLGWMALALRPGGDERLLWHNGGTGGFRSFCAFVPGERLRVVVLGADARPVDGLGQDLVRTVRAHPSTGSGRRPHS
jgi:CubicO group peptidase (beta-lactamase class C family)